MNLSMCREHFKNDFYFVALISHFSYRVELKAGPYSGSSQEGSHPGLTTPDVQGSA